MDEKEAIEILTSLINDNNFGSSISDALVVAIKALENQIKVKEVLMTPTLFAEKFDRIRKLEKIMID